MTMWLFTTPDFIKNSQSKTTFRIAHYCELLGHLFLILAMLSFIVLPYQKIGWEFNQNGSYDFNSVDQKLQNNEHLSNYSYSAIYITLIFWMISLTMFSIIALNKKEAINSWFNGMGFPYSIWISDELIYEKRARNEGIALLIVAIFTFIVLSVLLQILQ